MGTKAYRKIIYMETMMTNIVTVNNKTQLKSAINNKASLILIKDKALAKRIKHLKIASKASLGIAIVALGVVASNAWNPIAIGATATTLGIVGISGGSLLTLDLIILGFSVSLIMLIYNGYRITASYKKTMPDGKVEEAELILEKI